MAPSNVRVGMEGFSQSNDKKMVVEDAQGQQEKGGEARKGCPYASDSIKLAFGVRRLHPF